MPSVILKRWTMNCNFLIEEAAVLHLCRREFAGRYSFSSTVVLPERNWGTERAAAVKGLRTAVLLQERRIILAKHVTQQQPHVDCNATPGSRIVVTTATHDELPTRRVCVCVFVQSVQLSHWSVSGSTQSPFYDLKVWIWEETDFQLDASVFEAKARLAHPKNSRTDLRSVFKEVRGGGGGHLM